MSDWVCDVSICILEDAIEHSFEVNNMNGFLRTVLRTNMICKVLLKQGSFYENNKLFFNM